LKEHVAISLSYINKNDVKPKYFVQDVAYLFYILKKINLNELVPGPQSNTLSQDNKVNEIMIQLEFLGRNTESVIFVGMFPTFGRRRPSNVRESNKNFSSTT
jgi:hypothetical protein